MRGKENTNKTRVFSCKVFFPSFYGFVFLVAAGCPEPGRRNHSSFLTSRLHSYMCTTTTSSCIECNTRLDSQIKLQTNNTSWSLQGEKQDHHHFWHDRWVSLAIHTEWELAQISSLSVDDVGCVGGRKFGRGGLSVYHSTEERLSSSVRVCVCVCTKMCVFFWLWGVWVGGWSRLVSVDVGFWRWMFLVVGSWISLFQVSSFYLESARSQVMFGERFGGESRS